MKLEIENMSQSALDTQHLLYEFYQPQEIWYSIAAVGLASIIAMVVYDQVLQRVDRVDGPGADSASA